MKCQRVPTKLNSVAQQSMRATVYCHLSIRDHWALRCMSRCPDQVVSQKQKPQCSVPNDGAHLWLNGYFNKQNCRIWSEANPQVYVETPLHPEKLTVWCALWAGGILLQKR
ncbi:hypothetical protein TNCV_1085841 [Trichonephila clavipes]|nr:hypothetical protein TNCV_1085841 [Trichonephila clavipes]